MYQFSSNTKVEQKFKINDLLKMIKASKEIKEETKSIVSIQMTNALSEKTTGLKPSSEVNEIYVIRVDLDNKNVPYEFIKALDKTIRFQVLYELFFKDEVKYLTTYKLITDDKLTQLKTFESDWQQENIQELPLTTKLDDILKSTIAYITKFPFRHEESFEDYANRIVLIKKQKSEIERLTKTMNAEKQPNIKMRLNDLIKQKKIELKEVEN